MLNGKKVVKRWASLWRVELREVVTRILGRADGSLLKRVGKRRARVSGARSRFVLVVDCWGLVARSVAVRLLARCFSLVCGASVSLKSLAESIMLSLSSAESSEFSSSISSFWRASSSSFLRFMRSTSTETPSPSPVSLSTSSQTRFLSKVRGTFAFNLFSRSSGSLSSSLRLRMRSSRLVLSKALFLFTWRA